MDLIEVEITGQAITARYGTLNAGDILRTDKEFADHLVNDCRAAKYPGLKVKLPPAPPAKPAAKSKKAAGEKADKEPVAAPAPDAGGDPPDGADPVQTSALDPGAVGAADAPG